MKLACLFLSLTFGISIAQAQPKALVSGKFQKSDRNHIYIRKESGQTVKLPLKYSLGSPKNLSSGEKVSYEVPILELYKANKTNIKKLSRKKRRVSSVKTKR